MHGDCNESRCVRTRSVPGGAERGRRIAEVRLQQVDVGATRIPHTELRCIVWVDPIPQPFPSQARERHHDIARTDLVVQRVAFWLEYPVLHVALIGIELRLRSEIERSLP